MHISENEEGGKEIELSDDPYDCMRLNVENIPCIVTLCKVNGIAFCLQTCTGVNVCDHNYNKSEKSCFNDLKTLYYI